VTEKTKKSGLQRTAASDVSEPIGTRYPFIGGWFDRWPVVSSRIPELWAQFSGEGIPIEEYDDDRTHVIRAELPGVDAEEDIDIAVEDGLLSIRANRERSDETTDDDGSFRSEFHYGSFRRTMMLPAGTDADDVEATYHDGILEVRVPRNGDEPARKKVSISS
jgi:HSP20 family protein